MRGQRGVKGGKVWEGWSIKGEEIMKGWGLRVSGVGGALYEGK